MKAKEEEKMKLLHLSDLHIGKRVNEFSMMEDQTYILKQILSVAEQEAADGVILAGDLYDKPVPPAEAVQVMDRFLTQLADRNIPVFAVSGNHDSPERVAFGAELMRNRGIYLSPVYDGNVAAISLEDSYGQVCVYLLPFLRPSTVRHALAQEEGKITSYQDALKMAVERIHPDSGKRNVLVAHQFVTGAVRCDSEEVSVGGIDQVDASVFDEFDYVALGHIHSPQWVKRREVRYCGTPLKYSFSEADQEKSVTVVELEEKGKVKIRTIPLVPMRDMRKIRGTYMEVMERSFETGENRDDYVQITLTDEEDIPDGLQRLRTRYPRLMRLEYDNKRTREEHFLDGSSRAEEKSELELLEEFFELQNNQSMGKEQRRFAQELILSIQEGQDL